MYNQTIGTSCHQCRQKTTDTKTICRYWNRTKLAKFDLKKKTQFNFPGVGVALGFVASSVADAWRSDTERIVPR